MPLTDLYKIGERILLILHHGTPIPGKNRTDGIIEVLNRETNHVPSESFYSQLSD